MQRHSRGVKKDAAPALERRSLEERQQSYKFLTNATKRTYVIIEMDLF